MNAITIQRMEIRELSEILNIDLEEFPLDKTLMFYLDRYVIDIFKLEEMLGINSKNVSTAEIIRERYGNRAVEIIGKNI